jgi:hypothetical protein
MPNNNMPNNQYGGFLGNQPAIAALLAALNQPLQGPSTPRRKNTKSGKR